MAASQLGPTEATWGEVISLLNGKEVYLSMRPQKSVLCCRGSFLRCNSFQHRFAYDIPAAHNVQGGRTHFSVNFYSAIVSEPYWHGLQAQEVRAGVSPSGQ